MIVGTPSYSNSSANTRGRELARLVDHLAHSPRFSEQSNQTLQPACGRKSMYEVPFRVSHLLLALFSFSPPLEFSRNPPHQSLTQPGTSPSPSTNGPKSTHPRSSGAFHHSANRTPRNNEPRVQSWPVRNSRSDPQPHHPHPSPSIDVPPEYFSIDRGCRAQGKCLHPS